MSTPKLKRSQSQALTIDPFGSLPRLYPAPSLKSFRDDDQVPTRPRLMGAGIFWPRGPGAAIAGVPQGLQARYFLPHLGASKDRQVAKKREKEVGKIAKPLVDIARPFCANATRHGRNPLTEQEIRGAFKAVAGLKQMDVKDAAVQLKSLFHKDVAIDARTGGQGGNLSKAFHGVKEWARNQGYNIYSADAYFLLLAVLGKDAEAIAMMLIAGQPGIANRFFDVLSKQAVVETKLLRGVIVEATYLLETVSFELEEFRAPVRNVRDFIEGNIKAQGAKKYTKFMQLRNEMLDDTALPKTMTVDEKGIYHGLSEAGYRRFCRLLKKEDKQKLENIDTISDVATSPLGGIPSAGPFVGQAAAAVTKRVAKRFHPVRNYIGDIEDLRTQRMFKAKTDGEKEAVQRCIQEWVDIICAVAQETPRLTN